MSGEQPGPSNASRQWRRRRRRGAQQEEAEQEGPAAQRPRRNEVGAQGAVRNNDDPEFQAYRDRRCTICNAVFMRAGELDDHRFTYHGQQFYADESTRVYRSLVCTLCAIRFNSVRDLENHQANNHPHVQHGRGQLVLPAINFEEARFEDAFMHYSLNLDEGNYLIVDVDS